jgi:hypothetical protein
MAQDPRKKPPLEQAIELLDERSLDELKRSQVAADDIGNLRHARQLLTCATTGLPLSDRLAYLEQAESILRTLQAVALVAAQAYELVLEAKPLLQG